MKTARKLHKAHVKPSHIETVVSLSLMGGALHTLYLYIRPPLQSRVMFGDRGVPPLQSRPIMQSA